MTPTIPPSGLFYPNRFVRYLFLAMEDVMGTQGLASTRVLAEWDSTSLPPDDLERAIDFAALTRLNLALNAMYGDRGGRGMALRAGRSWFAHGLHHFGALRGVADPAFRALPLEERTRIGTLALAEVFTRFSDQASHLVEQPNTFQFVVAHSPFAHGVTAERPICHLLVGVLQEALRWVSNGRDYSVRETQCIASGGESCIFVINRHPFA